MSGDASTRNFSTISIRTRMLLMFQEAIFKSDDMAAAWREESLLSMTGENGKAPAPGAWSGGLPSVLTRGQLRSLGSGNRGKTRKPTPAIAASYLIAGTCRLGERRAIERPPPKAFPSLAA